MEKPIKFSRLKIEIKIAALSMLMECFFLVGLIQVWEKAPWIIKLLFFIIIISIPYYFIKSFFLRRASYQLLSIILPELEAGTLLPSDVDYIDESLKIIVYDHYLIGYAGGDCVDIYEIELMRIPVLGRSKSKTTVQVKLMSRGHFEIYTPSFLTTDPISGLHRLANYLNENFDIEIEAYD